MPQLFSILRHLCFKAPHDGTFDCIYRKGRSVAMQRNGSNAGPGNRLAIKQELALGCRL